MEKKDKATQSSKGKVEDAVKAIIVEKESEFQINVFGQLSITQLDTLLKRHGMVKDKENNNGKEHKTVKWHRIREERAQPPAFERWTLENELKLMELKKMEIDMSKERGRSSCNKNESR